MEAKIGDIINFEYKGKEYHQSIFELIPNYSETTWVADLGWDETERISFIIFGKMNKNGKPIKEELSIQIDDLDEEKTQIITL